MSDLTKRRLDRLQKAEAVARAAEAYLAPAECVCHRGRCPTLMGPRGKVLQDALAAWKVVGFLR